MPARDRLASVDPPWLHLVVLAPGEKAPAVRKAPAGFVARTIDGRRCRSKRALLSVLARALEFPAGSGRNWDALEELLADLDWLPAKGYLLIVTDAQELLAESDDDYDSFVEIMQSVAKEWATPRRGEWARAAVPFHVCLSVARDQEGARSDWQIPRLAPERRKR
jgi:RNAse (barnase) inhibitor barstar